MIVLTTLNSIQFKQNRLHLWKAVAGAFDHEWMRSTNKRSQRKGREYSCVVNIQQMFLSKHLRANPTILKYHSRSISWLPEVLETATIWGGTAFLLKALHGIDGSILPYWAGFSAISIGVRLLLFPVVLHGAHSAAELGKVLPDIQFAISLYMQEIRRLRARKASKAEERHQFRQAFRTVLAIYKRNSVNPYSIFLSPILQLPFFFYVSTDLRKIVNGLDPALAQELVESSVGWVTDLTEPDAWYGLPVLTGLIMYCNIEVSMGKKSLSGSSVAKANFGVLLKDMFQSGAVFMPCFLAQLPAGVQIYVLTSFLFTTLQSYILRTDALRQQVGLPSISAPSPEAVLAMQYIRLKKLELKAIEARGDGPLLGTGVLYNNFVASFAGPVRPSTIIPVGKKRPQPLALEVAKPMGPVTDGFIHGISAPYWQLLEKAQQEHRTQLEQAKQAMDLKSDDFMEDDSQAIERANRGETPRPVILQSEPATVPSKPVRLRRVPKQKKKKKR